MGASPRRRSALFEAPAMRRERASLLATFPARKKCKTTSAADACRFPPEITLRGARYTPSRVVADVAGGNGRVRAYEPEALEGGMIACKTFTPERGYLLEEEKNIADLVRADEKASRLFVEVFDEGRPSSPYLLMAYADVPLLPHARWSADVGTTLRVFADYVATLDELSGCANLAFMDATLANIGYSREDDKPRLLDLGAFYVAGDSRFKTIRPSYVHPRMWARNISSQGAFCTVEGGLFDVAELRAIGYYACFYETLDVLMRDEGARPPRAMLHTMKLYARRIRSDDLDALVAAEESYKGALRRSRAKYPELVDLMLECLDTDLSARSENGTCVADAARRAAAWARGR